MIDPRRHDEALDYVAKKLDIPESDLAPCTAMAVVDDEGNMVGGYVFRNWRGHDVEIALALEQDRVKGVVTRTIAPLFDYVFNQLGCVRMTALVRRGNKESRRLCEAMNFKLEGKARRGYDGRQDMMIYGLLKDECRWLG